MKKLLFGIALVLMVLASSAACTASRGSSPQSPTSGENWSMHRATQR